LARRLTGRPGTEGGGIEALREGARGGLRLPRCCRTSGRNRKGRYVSVPARSRVADALVDLQSPVRPRLEQVPDEMWRLIAGDAPLLAQVSGHLMGMRGKMFRPTLSLLSASIDGEPEPNAITVAAIAELIHLATLVHDDSVDHSALRRGMPTINSLFSHQVAVITGDYLYIRALAELVELETIDPMRVFMRASREM